MKKNIALIAGGNFSESEISFKSAKQMSNWLDSNKYNVYIVNIVGTEWVLKSDLFFDIPVNKNDFTVTVNHYTIKFDCALIAIHGNPGEDGHLQAYFEMIGIPYTTCGLLASALTFNKYMCKMYVKQFGVPSAKALLFKKGTNVDPQIVEKELGWPAFVKPNKHGSSFGVTKVKEASKIKPAVDNALHEDDEGIIEEFLSGTEVTCGLLKTRNKTITLPVTEIVPKTEYFDYDAKYKNLSEEITPARLSPELTKQIQELTSLVYDVLNCKGIIRVDFIIKDDKPYMLEVNTVPGMSEQSIIPQQVRVAGYTMPDILNIVLDEALAEA